jgi:diketogulonate reductase-like aldo/keto reductase
MPALGFGVYRSSPKETLGAVASALATGYRLIDTAAAYGNEVQVGEAMRKSDVARADVFVTTKLWISDYGYDEALHGFERSLRKLGLETLDLYLLHQPMPAEWERTVAAWTGRRQAVRGGAHTRHRRFQFRRPASRGSDRSHRHRAAGQSG